jgi:nucleoside-diphosphate-sugar epimerase
MTVLVTGAAGFLGSHVIRVLAEGGETPRAFTRPGDDVAALAECEIFSGDVADRATLEPALDGADLVINCAARTGPWGPRAEYERANVLGLETLVRAALAAGVRRVVHVSSITVHGNDVRGTADEDAPMRGEPNPYSRTKVAGERLLQELIRVEHAPVTIVRPGWIYGPGDQASFGRLARRIAQGQMAVIGRGDNQLPLVYIGDVARGVLLAGKAECADGGTYLLVNDERVSQREFLAAIAAELGVPEPARHLPYRVALAAGTVAETGWGLARRREPPPLMRYGMQLLGGDNRFVIERARRELGFEPSVGFAEGVRRAVDWYLGRSEPKSVTAVAA